MTNHSIGYVADTCEIPRCRQPAVLRYCTKSLCQRHWDELYEDEANEEAAKAALEPLISVLPTKHRTNWREFSGSSAPHRL